MPANVFLQRAWRTCEFVSFDTETTGKYPLGAEICELAAVKWRGGTITDTFSTLLKPSRPMMAENIAIHHITNEMVSSAPTIAEKIRAFHEFLGDAIPIAHHAPFDLGFMSIEFENARLSLPTYPVICTSLLARKAIPESGNHRLQTLIQHLKIEKGQAHRALDDAKACLQVALACMNRIGEGASLEEVFARQGGALEWTRFSLQNLAANESALTLISALRKGVSVSMVYDGGSRPGKPRIVRPEGLVRSLDGDYLVAFEADMAKAKRYLLEKISHVEM